MVKYPIIIDTVLLQEKKCIRTIGESGFAQQRFSQLIQFIGDNVVFPLTASPCIPCFTSFISTILVNYTLFEVLSSKLLMLNIRPWTANAGWWKVIKMLSFCQWGDTKRSSGYVLIFTIIWIITTRTSLPIMYS